MSIYLNNAASCFPRPEQVDKVIIDSINTPPYHPGRTGLNESKADFIAACRSHLAVLFNAPDSSDIILNSGATESLNTVLQGLVSERSHVITTAIEHNSTLRPLYRLVREQGIELTILECDSNGFVDPDRFAEALQDNTSLVVMNHCSNVTGAVQDVHAVSKIVHAAGALLVIDGSQSAGLYHIDVVHDEIDVFVFAGHKYLYGLSGTGGFYLKPGLPLRPLKVGGTGVRSDLKGQPADRPMLYESGTPNMIGLAALNAGVKYVLQQGVDPLRNHLFAQVHTLQQELGRLGDLKLYAPDLTGKTSMLSFNIDGNSPEETSYLLEHLFGIVTRSGLHCAPLIHPFIGSGSTGCVRVSPSVLTTEKQIDCVIKAIKQITQMTACHI